MLIAYLLQKVTQVIQFQLGHSKYRLPKLPHQATKVDHKDPFFLDGADLELCQTLLNGFKKLMLLNNHHAAFSEVQNITSQIKKLGHSLHAACYQATWKFNC